MDRIVTHIATRERLMTQPHPAVECGVVTARQRCQGEGDSAKSRLGGFDADRAVATAALKDALMRRSITAPVEAHLQTRLGLVP